MGHKHTKLAGINRNLRIMQRIITVAIVTTINILRELVLFHRKIVIMYFKPLLFTLELGFSTPFNRIEYGREKKNS